MKRSKRIQLRVTALEHARYMKVAKENRISLAEFIRKKLDGQHLDPKLSNKDLDLMKKLLIESNRWQSISNLFKKRDPKISEEVRVLIKELREIIIQNFR